jgi:2-polyprenyl-6-hydroxyphenyl methylase/3-demethylubiquinone-9 3-methyltransferase
LPSFKSKSSQNWIYEDLSHTWWDENGILHLLKTMVNPWRVPFFAEALSKSFGGDLGSRILLDIGCGGGLLSEEFRKMGCQVHGIDLSANSIIVAQEHARKQGLKINYQVASGTQLAFAECTLDIVACCDVLEHITDWETVIAETSRILKPEGIFLFDTINRTLRSFIVMILGAQINPTTQIFPKDTHSWRMFIRPVELERSLAQHGMILRDIRGGEIQGSLFSNAREIQSLKRGEITVRELGTRLCLRESENLAANYLGVAQKRNR